MRRRKIIRISAVIAFFLLLSLAWFGFREVKPLSISVGPVFYSADRVLVASFVVKNTSASPIQYSSPYVKARVLGEFGWRSIPSPSGVPPHSRQILSPGQSTINWVELPLEARRWSIGYLARTDSSLNVMWQNWPTEIPDRVWRMLAKAISDQPGATQLIWSNELDAQSWKEAHPQEMFEAKTLRLIYAGEPLFD